MEEPEVYWLPYIETAEQVKILAGAVKFKPVKGKKLKDKLNGKEEFEQEFISRAVLRKKSHRLGNTVRLNHYRLKPVGSVCG